MNSRREYLEDLEVKINEFIGTLTLCEINSNFNLRRKIMRIKTFLSDREITSLKFNQNESDFRVNDFL